MAILHAAFVSEGQDITIGNLNKVVTDITTLATLKRAVRREGGQFSASGSSVNVTTLMTGKTAGGSESTLGVVAGPADTTNNKVDLVYATGVNRGDHVVIPETGARVYGRLTFAGGVWTITFKTIDTNGTEVGHTFGSATAVLWYYWEIFNFHETPTFPDVFAIASDNASAQVPDATTTTKGKVRIGSNLTVANGVLSLDGSGVVGALGFTPSTNTHNHDTVYAPLAHVGAGGSAHSAATTSSAGFMTSAMVSKLASIADNANNYTLPTASAATLGGVKVGARLSIDANGVLSAADQAYTHPTGAGNLHVPAFDILSQGRVLRARDLDGMPAWESLVASDIPSLDAAKIVSGTFDAARIPNLDAGKITSGTFAAARIPNLSSTYAVTGHKHAWADITSGVPSPVITLSGDASGSGTMTSLGSVTIAVEVANDSHNHTILHAHDLRDVKPSTTGIGNSKAIKAFFTTLGGLTGGANTDYQDLIVLDTYSDTSGGNVNALSFDKDTMLIRHYQAAQGATTWGTPKSIAYTDSSITGNAATATTATTATKLATSRTISLTGDVTGSVSFDGSANASITATVADNSHSHTIANITSLQATLDGKAASSHNHDASHINAGTLWVARGGTGASSLTSNGVLYGAGTGAIQATAPGGISQVLTGGATAPTWSSAPTESGQVLTATGPSSAPEWKQYLPPGVIMPFAGTYAPPGWLLCNGQGVSRTDFAALFAVLGTTYGAGNGSTSFNVPDLRGRVVAGLDNMGSFPANVVQAAEADTLGGKAGTETHTLTEAQMPNHNHGASDSGHSHQYYANIQHSDGTLVTGEYITANLAYGSARRRYMDYTQGANAVVSVGAKGGGGAHPNMQPTMFMSYIIKT